ncbi:ATP-binding cassette long-chain fatty acid transporter pxa1 [Microbotryomycetes sp. JL221]|nr:ATP-binding cassette long-chain fatty acid transporter pxa1 [Microbotryomycetes sp. JL221]
MAPAQSKLATAQATKSTLTSLLFQTRTKPTTLALPLVIALYILRKRIMQASIDKKKNRDTMAATALSTPQLELAQRDLYKPLPGGARELLVPNRGRVSKVVIRPTKPTTFQAHRKFFKPANKQQQQTNLKTTQQPRVGVNKEFFRQLKAIFKIIMPRWTSKEVLLVAAHTSFLLLRTWLSLLVAKLDGRLVGDLVSANGKGFAQGLMYWFMLAIPSVYTNSMIRYLQQKLSISFRTRLTRYVHDLYLSPDNTFYKIVNLDSRIQGADQFITTDIARFCETLSALYSNISKPTLDLILFNVQLGRSIGAKGSVGLFVSYVATAVLLRKVTPAFGKLAAIEAKLEGDFRNAHSRLIINAEEVAFYDGAPIEKDILNRAYLRLIKHVNSIFKIRILYGMIEDFIVKYMWSACGYCLISIPVFFNRVGQQTTTKTIGEDTLIKPVGNRDDSNQVAKRTEDYISNRRLLLALADAGGRLMYSWKDLAELAGYTSRVYSLLSTLHDLDQNKFQSTTRPIDLPSNETFYDLGTINGKLVIERLKGFEDEEGVCFEKVPIVAPAPGMTRGGEELVKKLNLKIKKGQHLLITGPNGCGKTSVARVIAGLWPVFEGVTRRPEDKDIMFLPQRPYLSAGSLRDQIIYPHAYPDFIASGKTEQDLLNILKHVHLAYLPSREGGLDTRKEWKDVLSGGEKQRMGMARLFYHLPKYGVLDECTSAVSTDVEGMMYQHAKDLGITLITISHRPSLFKYHQHLLRLTGHDGEWETSQIGTEVETLSFQKEIESLQERLRDVDDWKIRLKEIERELAFKKPE